MAGKVSPTRKQDRRNPRAEAIGRRLTRARKQAGLTQEQVAAALNISVPTYRHYEKGRHLFPSELLDRLPALLQMPVTFFLGMPDPANLDEDERRLLETYRSIQNEDIRAGILGYAQHQLKIDRELRERTGL